MVITVPSRIVSACLFSWLAFWPLALLVPRMPLFDFLNAMGLSFGLAVLWRYGPASWIAIQRTAQRTLSRGHLLVLGIEATWLAMVLRTVILWTWRWNGEPTGRLDGIETAWAAWIIVSGGVFHLLACSLPDAEVADEPLPMVEGRVLFGAFVAGLVLGALIAGARWWQAWTG